MYRDTTDYDTAGTWRFDMYSSFCRGVESGLKAPGFKTRVPLPRLPVQYALLAVVGMAIFPSLYLTAINGTRLVVRCARQVATFGQAFLANVVALGTSILACIAAFLNGISIVVKWTCQLVAIPMPAAFNVATIFVSGLTSISLVFLTIVMCWGTQTFDAAYVWWTGGRRWSDVAGVDKGTQTPQVMSGICTERAADCKDMIRRYYELDNVLDMERDEHSNELARRDKVLRDRDANVRRLQITLQSGERKLSAAKKELAATKAELEKSSQQVREASSQPLEVKLETLKQDAKHLKAEGDNARLQEQLKDLTKKIERLEYDLATEKRAHADDQKNNLEAAQAASDLGKSKEAEAAQKIESLERDLSILNGKFAEEQEGRQKVTERAEAQLHAWRQEAIQRVQGLEQALAAQEEKIAALEREKQAHQQELSTWQQQLHWKGLEAAQTKEKQAELDAATEHQLKVLKEQLTVERQTGAAREAKHYKEQQEAKEKFAEACKLKTPKEKITDFPVEDLLMEVLSLASEDDPFGSDVLLYYWAQELKTKLWEVLPDENAPEEPKPAATSERVEASQEVLAARHILPLKSRGKKPEE